MPFIADKDRDAKTYEYITADILPECRSVMEMRFTYLLQMSNKYGDAFKVAFRDPETGAWSKWAPFPSLLLQASREVNGAVVERAHITPAIDVHRSVLENEIIIESDYPTYEENAEASRIVGAILEKKGFISHYYFSGNKSVHNHIFVDLEGLESLDYNNRERIDQRFAGLESRFRPAFMEWLRTKMINCWDTGVRKFDAELVRASHLIRAELSKNKLGYKTFLGNVSQDIGPEPCICNEDNGVHPRIGQITLSRPDFNELVEEFIASLVAQDARKRLCSTNRRLQSWMPGKDEVPRECVKVLLSDAFRAVGDGKSRGMFILVNELKRIYGEDLARNIMRDWNARMGNPIPWNDIEYRLKMKGYSLSCEFIHSFLNGLGLTVSQKCNGKVYKQ